MHGPPHPLVRRSTAVPALLLSCVSLAASCATLPSDSDEGSLPSALAGPFRAIDQEELGNSRAAPHVMNDDERFARDASVVDLDGDPATLAAAGFFAATLRPEDAPPDPLAPPNAIVRHDAADGRSFGRASVTVLTPELPWEGGVAAAPSALLVGGEIWLYYAAEGGIGLARSADGVAFARAPSPVLAPLASGDGGWERGAVPGSPGVVRLPDGSLRMFYVIAGDGDASFVGEARSDDGLAWERVGDGPALAPAPRPARARASAPVSEDEPFDSAAVFDPAPVLAVSATGRPSLRVYYAGRDSAGRSAIGLAARFGPDGPLQRAAAPVFGASSALAPRAPCVAAYPGFSLLFVTQAAGAGDGQRYPAVAAGVAPADASLPPPGP
ncbi:hypothetical protein [Sorangium sp. So ce362]|uniref:hypothetical protein n=1 Tax=Sorangium sp. So ce362 TaxID=3133303 RepID=UPI003F5E8876